MSENTIPAIHNYNSIFVDTNVIINLIRSDPTGLSLNELMTSGSTLYITDTVNEELRSNLSGQNFSTYNLWAFNNYGEGRVLPYPSDVPVGRNAGEQSIINAINDGFRDGPYLVLTGDNEARIELNNNLSVDTLNSIELANSLLLSGEINYIRYGVLVGQVGIVAPHELVNENGISTVLIPGGDIISYNVNGAIIEIRPNGLKVNGEFVGLLQKFEIDPSTGQVSVSGPENCFLAGTPITMHDGSTKNIEDITPDDIVMSYDETGKLVPGRVTKTFQNQVKHILNVHGLMVTPGHVTLCGDGAFKGQHVPMIDIIRSDGAVVKTDGTLVRVNTNCTIGSYEDQFVLLAIGEMGTDGLHMRDQGRVRIGMRFILPDGRDMSIAEILAASGATVNDEGLVDSKTMPEPTPLHLSFLEAMPQVEDYILARSGLSLDEIYDAGEWEATRPQMPAPVRAKQHPKSEGILMAEANYKSPPKLH